VRAGVAVLLASVGIGSPPLLAGSFEVHGVAAARGLWVEGQPSWLVGGFGRLSEGSVAPGADESAARGQFHLGLDWKPGETWLVHAHAVAHAEPSSNGGERGGLAAGYVQFRPELTPSLALRLQGGILFNHTSLENTGRLWQSPYTLTLSALNTWLAEEVRLGGLDVLAQWGDGRDEIEAGGAAFGGNDTAGTLLAWRGWSFGDRLTSVAERLPLPPLRSFGPGEPFAAQATTTEPFEELDHRLGWQARARWTRPGVVRLQVAHQRHRGDRLLHDGQYAWETTFTSAGIALGAGRAFTLLAEGAVGDTGMGPPGGPHVETRFSVGYVLGSWTWAGWRISTRYDRFRNEDRDGTAEPDGEHGEAFTVAVMWQPARLLRLGAEYLDVRSQRPAAAYSGADPDTDARRVLVEARLVF
jgi:hypothetical protein